MANTRENSLSQHAVGWMCGWWDWNIQVEAQVAAYILQGCVLSIGVDMDGSAGCHGVRRRKVNVIFGEGECGECFFGVGSYDVSTPEIVMRPGTKEQRLFL
jgi:hypothetical protein